MDPLSLSTTACYPEVRSQMDVSQYMNLQEPAAFGWLLKLPRIASKTLLNASRSTSNQIRTARLRHLTAYPSTLKPKTSYVYICVFSLLF